MAFFLLSIDNSAPGNFQKRAGAIEVSFGSGNSRGGSSPMIQQMQKQKVVTDSPKSFRKKIESTPSKTSTTSSEVADFSTESSSTHGLGTGSGSGTGTGTTSGSGAGFNDPSIRYRGMVRELVNSKKHYPRKARSLNQEGVVVAKIKLNKAGKLLQAEIVKGSAFEILDEATMSAIRDVDQFPAIPNELGLDEITFNIPFEYSSL